MRHSQYEMRICQKSYKKSQRQFMYGSNFYGSDVNSGFHVVKLELEIGLTWFISLIHKSSVACKQKVV